MSDHRGQAERRGSWTLVAAWGGLIALLLINLPAFLCMGLDSDASSYDLVARRVALGGVHYRDLLDANLPGIVWLHMVFRSLLGWRSEALRMADFTIVALSAWLLVTWLPRSSLAWRRVALAGGLLAFYLSTSEWVHCQRDVWMLLPALSALRLRARQTDRLAIQATTFWALAGWALVEGMAWAAAFWIKPFVAVPAATAWLIAAKQTCGTTGAKRRVAVDLVALLAGGLLVGTAGITWLFTTGAWPTFVEVMFVWNREYFAFNVLGSEPWIPLLSLVLRLFPWVLVHLAAVPLAVDAIWWKNRRAPSAFPLLAGFYLAWLSQAILLQHLYDYVHVPPILLGVAVLAVSGCVREAPRTSSLLARLRAYPAVSAFMLFCLLWSYPALLAQRAAAWVQCVTEGSTPAVRDRVTVLRRLNWTNLDLVTKFLRDQGVRDREVTSFSLPTVALYGDLDLAPSTRYIFLQDHLDIFAKRRSLILAALANSRQKFLVCDLGRYNMQRVRESLDDKSGPQGRQVAFRAGDYVVFRLGGAEMPAWLDQHFTLSTE